jgi:outer membrane protein TolC
MFLSTLKKNNLPVLLSFLLVMTSCRSTFCPDEDLIEIPCHWSTPIQGGMTVEDPSEFLWWEALDDTLLTTLVEQAASRNNDVHLASTQSNEKLLETINAVTSEVAKNYIELRGMQTRLEILQTSIEVQNKIFILNEGLSTSGLIDQNENKKNLDSLLVQKSQIELSIKKTIFHLSTLLGFVPGGLCDNLYQFQKLPELPNSMPVGFPMDLIQRNPTVQEAKKQYEMAHNKETFYNYKKTVLNVLEGAEIALATFLFELKKIYYLNDINRLKGDSYLLTKDLHHRGLKDDRDLLRVYQEVLSEENAFIQSKIELLSNYVSLYQVLGGCWE